MAGTEDLDALYNASYRRLVVQLFAICGDLGDAEDAVQEAFVTAIRKHRELARVANPEAWVRTVAVNRLRARVAARRRRAEVPAGRTRAAGGRGGRAGARRDRVRAGAGSTRDQRQVVVLHYLADLGTAAIAARAGGPRGHREVPVGQGARPAGPAAGDDKEDRHA